MLRKENKELAEVRAGATSELTCRTQEEDCPDEHTKQNTQNLPLQRQFSLDKVVVRYLDFDYPRFWAWRARYVWQPGGLKKRQSEQRTCKCRSKYGREEEEVSIMAHCQSSTLFTAAEALQAPFLIRRRTISGANAACVATTLVRAGEKRK